MTYCDELIKCDEALDDEFVIDHYDQFDDKDSLFDYCERRNLAKAIAFLDFGYDFAKLSRNKREFRKLSEEFIEKHQDRFKWADICKHQKLSERFMERFESRISWTTISTTQVLSENFIEKHCDKVSWCNILHHQKISEGIIEKYVDRYNDSCWLNLSRNQRLSENFIDKYSDRVIWHNILETQDISEALIEKHAYRFKDDLCCLTKLSKSSKISEKMRKEYEQKVRGFEGPRKTKWYDYR